MTLLVLSSNTEVTLAAEDGQSVRAGATSDIKVRKTSINTVKKKYKKIQKKNTVQLQGHHASSGEVFTLLYLNQVQDLLSEYIT